MDNQAFFREFARGRLAVLGDDYSEPGRAVLVAPAQNISPDEVNTLLSLSPGLLFAALPESRADAFMLPRMARPQVFSAPQAPADQLLDFCVSCEARQGVTTGISSSDRAATLRVLADDNPNPRQLIMPGHIFPVRARSGGVLVKNALAEGALDLVRAAKLGECAVFVDLLDPAGSLLSLQQSSAFAEARALPRLLLSELIHHRLEHEHLIQRVAEARLPTLLAGELRSFVYRSEFHGGEHLALVKGEIRTGQIVLTRVQTESTLSDVFGGGNPPSRLRLHRSLEAIGRRGQGVLVYLRRPSRGQLSEQVDGTSRSTAVRPAVWLREYGIGAQILRDLGVQRIELLMSTRRSLTGLSAFGIEIVAEAPL